MLKIIIENFKLKKGGGRWREGQQRNVVQISYIDKKY